MKNVKDLVLVTNLQYLNFIHILGVCLFLSLTTLNLDYIVFKQAYFMFNTFQSCVYEVRLVLDHFEL